MKHTRILAAILAVLLLPVSLAGCADTQAVDLTVSCPAEIIDVQPADENFTQSQLAFGVELFRRSVAESIGNAEQKNVLVSPLSVGIALSMTANGAVGETLSEMETVLGMPVEDLNSAYLAYRSALPQSDKYSLSTANSVWFRDDANRLKVREDFLSTLVSYYDAQAFAAPFDSATLRDINAWVEEHTDGRIDRIISEINPDTVMYLINALAFEAEWEKVYESDDILERTFTAYTGEKRDIELMRSTENVYLSDTDAEGFVRYYKDRKYAFAALLPEEGTDIYDYIDGLTAEKLSSILENAQQSEVIALVPQFEADYAARLNDVLSAMGMPTAFDMAAADFSGLGTSPDGNIFIGQVIHKTYISVDAMGTKAAAVTAVMMESGSAAPVTPSVVLNRPFVYMILDTSTNLPLFFGCVTDIGAE